MTLGLAFAAVRSKDPAPIHRTRAGEVPMFRRLALCLLLALPSAQAQLSNPALSKSISNMLNQLGSPAAPGAQAKPGTAGAVNLSFKPSAQVRQKALTTFVEGFRGQSPEAADQLAQAFQQEDLFASIEGQVKALYGLGINDVADTWAVYWSYVWLLGQGNSADPTKAQVLGLRKQFHKLLGSIPEIASASEARKQELADAMTLQLLLLSIVTETYRNEPENLKAFAVPLSQQLGLDVTRLDLTDEGFRVKR